MIAVISGTGSLPQKACKNLISSNKPFFVISLFPENNGALLQIACKNKAEVLTEKFYKVGKIINLLKQKNTKQVLLIGKVDKRNLFKKIKMDWVGIKLLASMVSKSDKNIMEKILSVLENEGMQVIHQNDILHTLLLDPGLYTGKITDYIKQNINFGMQVAHDISQLDVGQTVVVKGKMIMAIEAIEGTNECIKRGIELGKKGVVICKSAHQNKNKKYDLPTLGTNSLSNIKPGQVAAIAWKADKTFIADKDAFIKQAKELNITLVAV